MAYNSNYVSVYDGTSAYSVNALAIELSLSRDFEDAYFGDTALVRLIRDGGIGMNKGYTVEGSKILLPILLADGTTAAAGVTYANELTQPTAEFVTGLTQAQYNIAHYRKTWWLDARSKKLGTGAKTATRGDLLGGVAKQIQGSFRTILSTDVMSSTQDSANGNNVLGVRYGLSTSNSPGNISQTTYTTWAAKVNSAGGIFTLDAVNDLYDLAQRGDEKADILFVSSTSTNNLYGKVRSAIQPSQQLVNVNNSGTYGLSDMQYLTMKVVKDDVGTAGEFIGLHSKSFYWVGDTRPTLAASGPWPGTDAEWMTWAMFCAMGCNNWRLQFIGKSFV